MAKQISVGVVGLDHWYTAFGVVRAAAQGPGTSLAAVADKSRRRLAAVTKETKPGYTTSDFRKVIADPDVDLICCLVNTRDSVALTRAALRAGKHVACVKPMAMNLRQADALIELAERQGCVLWSFDQLGRAGASKELKSLLKRGAIGQPLSFYQVMESGLPRSWPNSTSPGWWIDEKLVPFGAWADHAIYTIDMLRALFDADVEAVHGEIANRRYPRLKVEDWGAAVLRLSNGVVAVLEDTWTADSYSPHWTKIVGTKGAVHMEPAAFKEPVVVATPKGVKALPAPARRGGPLGPVLKLINAGAAKPSPARESRTNLAIALAVYKSAKTGKYVRPDEMR